MGSVLVIAAVAALFGFVLGLIARAGVLLLASACVIAVIVVGGLLSGESWGNIALYSAVALVCFQPAYIISVMVIRPRLHRTRRTPSPGKTGFAPDAQPPKGQKGPSLH